MTTPSPSPSPPPPHSPSSNPSPVNKKPQAAPWTHQETVFLIQSYQEKWYAMKRGQLKASQWEEIAVAVAVRCGYDYSHPAKSAVQCRHKMEKLRRRHREEKRIVSVGGKSFWPYFELMETLERGPMPISARPPLSALVSCRENYANGNNSYHNTDNGMVGYNEDEDQDEEVEEEDNEEGEEEEGDYSGRSRSRSINYILRKPTIVNRFSGNAQVGVLREAMRKRAREEAEAAEEREEEGGRRESGRGREMELGMSLAGEIRGFAEKMVRLERKKMEVMKETERWRMEMENKRVEMILDSQRKVVDTIAAAFGSDVDDEL